MSKPRSAPGGGEWQYHPRSDHHSKVACWGILFDLLLESGVLRKHVASGAVIFGVNHEMTDFKHNRKKDLDMVLARPRGEAGGETFKGLVDKYNIALSTDEKKRLAALPDIHRGIVGSVQAALEAKACMTEHGKARPRLYDELNSSHETIHASADEAIAVGFCMVNVAEVFRSPLRKVASKHKQPDAAGSVIDKIHEMPRRTKGGEQGFDAISVVVVDCKNDGSPVKYSTAPPAPAAGSIYEYEIMIRRVAQLYASRFTSL